MFELMSKLFFVSKIYTVLDRRKMIGSSTCPVQFLLAG